ncbi:S-adenosyl-L-methionine-dependent methyltransferase [Lentinula raphanica]|uniref:S-adenosyl-L-methionine-dependent methyltransferase n=1 Tax=Lentinula raphanica TaxID=153919 RepID=A0AA38P2Y8_9AGAR|nr:S-adenosyl-L-methionine-dependent methyltransferase [Lentinula raphanica]KAJ3827116.1 S-adenosyl-L-methionine-dependent methyltransferase [Lentinula raphanica]KAJ3835340.1 S-adenosyl-L-methionine-dependent methyltransferase [Lentinula raphanica]KAJ3977965.1 S-adenosyl-L-methionine-dependent methyltransferase [Lentinula raphanica]
MSSELQQLLDTITGAVKSLNQACASNGTSVPSLDEPFQPSSESFRGNFEALQAARIISAAALQLEAVVAPPQVVLYHVAGGFFKSMALRVCLESNVTEILREAGSKGMHVRDIAKHNGQDSEKLARFLRYLCSNHVYREISPNVFANNRISSLLDTQKSIDELRSRPLDKYKNTDGMAALVGHHLDECFKGAAYAWETLNDPNMRDVQEHLDTPLNKAFNSQIPYFKFVLNDDHRRLRFDVSMQGMEKVQPPDTTLNAFEWEKLSEGSKVVDVGGGVGTVLFPLAEKFPDLQLVIQDLPAVVNNAKKVWTERMPSALETGRVIPEAHNFFDIQPQKDASVFLLKHVLHNWSDSSCLKILKRLRDASNDTTRLLIMDSAMPYVCRLQDQHTSETASEEAPRPLLANYGALNEISYVLDMVMFVILNTQERTYEQLERLLTESGWSVSSLRRRPGDGAFVQIEAKPMKLTEGSHSRL